MALCVSVHEDEVDFSNLQDQDEEYVCLPIHESTKRVEDEGEEELELFFFSSHGRCKQDEENEEMDEEQQILCEGSCWLYCG